MCYIFPCPHLSNSNKRTLHPNEPQEMTICIATPLFLKISEKMERCVFFSNNINDNIEAEDFFDGCFRKGG